MEKLLYIIPILLSLIATMFTYLMIFLGSCTDLLFKNVSKKILDFFLAFGAGIIISIGFLFGGLFIIIADIFLNKLLINKNIKTSNRSILMFSAITLHNIPEGIGSIIRN